MSRELKEKVSTLEATLQAFIRHTERSFSKVNNSFIDLHNEMNDFKDEMADFKDEMAVFKDEMAVFKDEMAVFKDEMKDFKDEMKGFKGEMSDFKDEMKGFKSEMNDFKDEMKGFKTEMARRWGDLANRLGTLAEDVVAPNLIPAARKYFNCQGEPLDFMPRRVRAHSREKGRSREFDAIVVFEDTVILSETKSTPRSEYVKDFVQVIHEFYDYFPELTGKKLIPVFASLNVEENIIKQATKNKIYVMALKGDTMEILNYNEVQENMR